MEVSLPVVEGDREKDGEGGDGYSYQEQTQARTSDQAGQARLARPSTLNAGRVVYAEAHGL